MHFGSFPTPVAAQVRTLLTGLESHRLFVFGSPTFRLERAIFEGDAALELNSCGSGLYSHALGSWLAGRAPEYRFTGALEVLERALAGASARRRAAGALVALQLAPFLKGEPNSFKEAHLRHLVGRLGEMLTASEVKLQAAFPALKLASYRQDGFAAHMVTAKEARATVALLSLAKAERQDGLLRWIDRNAEWPGVELKPDPVELAGSGVDYLIVSDRQLEGLEPKAAYQGAGSQRFWCYRDRKGATLRRAQAGGKPFAYKPLDLSKVTASTKVQVNRVDGPTAMYIRSIYLKKTIKPAPGEHNYLIYLDGMLAGVLVYAVKQGSFAAVLAIKAASKRAGMSAAYLLSDLSVSREARVSKLIARLAANSGVLRDMAVRSVLPLKYITTTAFSEHPASMKYRGVYELLSRKDAEPPQTGHVLQYGCEAFDEPPQQAFAWWWSAHGNPEKPKPSGGRGGRR